MEARYSRNLKLQKTHFFVGLAISLIFTLLIAINGFNFWVWQANIMDGLLHFAGVPHKLIILRGSAEDSILSPLFRSYVSTSPTFEMSINYRSIPLMAVIISLILLASSILIVNIFRIIPPPIKAVWSVVSILAILTLLWQTIVSPIPSYTLHWVTIDWSCSGVINMCLITLIYVPFLFTIKGPLWIKISWLFIAIGFSIVWNLLRLSLVTATLYYFGGIAFLLFHYVVGAFIEFVYIVAFYSLALAHLSKYEVSGAMGFGA